MNSYMRFSPSAGCFYDLRFHKNVSDDAIEVTVDEFNMLAAGRNTGKQIIVDGGRLVLADRELPLAEIEAKERVWRDTELAGVQWLRDRHRDQVEIGATPTLTPNQFNELLIYIQELRDWPQSEHFPEVKHRPEAPTWISEVSE